METGYHTPLEEYLETISTLSDEGTEVIGARVAERMGRSAPAVKEMLDRLEDDGFVSRDGRVISLTEEGRSIATTVTRRHRLAERLLVDVIGLEWHKVHVEAGRWEHVISADVEAKLIALLGDPATCPHGNPIPGSSASRREERVLVDAKIGETVTLVRINELVEHDMVALEAMDAAGFIPGRQGIVESISSEGAVTITGQAGRLTLSVANSRNLFVAA